MIVLGFYVALFVASFLVVRLLRRRGARNDLTSRKTVTFGDESAIRPDRTASVISVLAIFLIWGAFTGSRIVPLHVPGPFLGDMSFTYTAENAAGQRDDATVTVRAYRGDKPAAPEVAPGEGFARDDSAVVAAWRSVLIRPADNDQDSGQEGYRIVAIDGQPVGPDQSVEVAQGRVLLTSKGSLNIEPSKGLQMEPIWLPAPETVVARFFEIARDGYQNISLWEHLGASLMRVLAGFALGSLVGIPLGYAMGLSGWFRGWFDPIVEFMRPVPPLALIPLVIIWFGIWESGKIVLLFLAALWIMTIAARSGVSGVRISKIHAAYSLGASKTQILRHVIIPNSLPDIFTGARVAMGVCWGTVVAAELVAAQKGAGMMIIAASKFQLTDIVVMGIILIGVIGYGIDTLMRMAEKALVPWKGRG
ncbi:MAG: ABC transporter permease [Cereibacter changlensis]|uniref:Taurine ABC transporter permease n=2 Tax=Cereibacter changlensis TaxID=402884 RepID=A0A2T4JTX3_9RHOB|nr:ABC transporter permease [Cereibacter changlensis]PTE21267.1 taurine ABC transporter permease [Cereibacter changlensis JA139]PZX58884.1 taurine transport system permease protein [Cereibacter changlensis]